MKLTVKQLSALSGVSPRTLRYYDETGLLTPERISSNGYRIYGQREIDSLQQILFYRELGIPLDKIKSLISDPHFDREAALTGHLQALFTRREQLDVLIRNVEKTICELKGEAVMSNSEKFEGFKAALIDDNEKRYGKELREKYGNDAINASNAKVSGMNRESWRNQEELFSEISELIKSAMSRSDPACSDAKRACELHREWLCLFWKDGTYSKEAHLSIGSMYVSDERFREYYENISPGFADFFKKALEIYCE